MNTNSGDFSKSRHCLTLCGASPIYLLHYLCIKFLYIVILTDVNKMNQSCNYLLVEK